MAWSYDTTLDGPPSQFHGDPLVTRDLIVVGSDGHPGGHLYAFDRTSGRVRWKLPLEGGVATQVFRWNEMVLAVGMDSEIVAVDLATGTVRWRFEGPEEARIAYAGDPILGDGRLFVPWRPGLLDAFDAETGELLWRRSLGTELNTSAALYHGEVVVGGFDGRLFRFEPKTGEPLGAFDPGLPGCVLYGDLVPAGKCLLTLQAASGTADSPELQGPYRVSCLRPAEGGVSWTRQSVTEWSTSRPLVWRDHVVVGTDGLLQAFDSRDGGILWELQIEGVPRGLGASEEYLLVGTRSGKLFAHAWTSPLRGEDERQHGASPQPAG